MFIKKRVWDLHSLKLFLSIFILLPLIAVFVNGASCDIIVNPLVVDAENDYSANAGRVTVFGEGAGNSFSETTNVQINCNVDNLQPGANQNIVAARIPAFSQSLLSYTGYCSYKTSSSDVEYKISATILPDNTICTKGGNGYAKVMVKASSKAIVDTTCKNADEIYDSDYKKCVGCGDYGENKCSDGKCRGDWIPDARGKCTEKSANDVKDDEEKKPQPIKPIKQPIDDGENGQGGLEINDGEARELRFGLDWKWSLIGVPYGEILSEEHSCISKIYYYDKGSGKYKKVTNLKDKSLIGKGLWARKKTGNKVGDCTMKYTGRFLSSQTIALKRGWNLVSIQTERSLDVTKSSCKIANGPFMYSGFVLNGKPQGYMKREQLNFGTGYWIKVAEDCRLSNEDEDAPPAPPGESEQTSSVQNPSAGAIEPMGGRGRRFVEDAG